MILPDKPLSNENLHRLLNPGTCYKNNSAKTLSNNSLFVTMTFWNLGTKGCVSFDWGDADAAKNNNTPPTTRHRSQRTQSQEGTSLPTSTKQRQQRDSNDADLGDYAPKLRLQQLWQDSNNNNNSKIATATVWQ